MKIKFYVDRNGRLAVRCSEYGFYERKDGSIFYSQVRFATSKGDIPYIRVVGFSERNYLVGEFTTKKYYLEISPKISY